MRCEAVLGAVVLLCAAGAAWAEEAQVRGKVLIVADEQKNMEVLAEFLRKDGGYDVAIVDEKGMPADLAPYHAVFQFIHGPMQDSTGKAMIEYAEHGGRLVLLHHAIASARNKNPEFLKFVGIKISPRDDPKAPWRVIANTTYALVNLKADHYITSHNVKYDRTAEYRSPEPGGLAGNFPALELAATEAFVNQQFTDGREKTVLFGFRVTDPKTGETVMQDRAGWLKPAGKGWVFYFQPGHAESDFRNRNYCQIILNSLVWKPEKP
jgi:hypothetical protein